MRRMLLRGVPNSRGPRKKGRHLQGGHRQLILRLFPHRILIMTMEEFTISYAYDFESQVNWQSKENCDLKARREKYHPNWDLGLFFFLASFHPTSPHPSKSNADLLHGHFLLSPMLPLLSRGESLAQTMSKHPHSLLPHRHSLAPPALAFQET